MHRTLEINCDVVGPVRLAAKLSLDNEGKINYSSRECLCGREHYGFVISTEPSVTALRACAAMLATDVIFHIRRLIYDGLRTYRTYREGEVL